MIALVYHCSGGCRRIFFKHLKTVNEIPSKYKQLADILLKVRKVESGVTTDTKCKVGNYFTTAILIIPMLN